MLSGGLVVEAPEVAGERAGPDRDDAGEGEVTGVDAIHPVEQSPTTFGEQRRSDRTAEAVDLMLCGGPGRACCSCEADARRVREPPFDESTQPCGGAAVDGQDGDPWIVADVAAELDVKHVEVRALGGFTEVERADG